jgi:signal transduction histidine kinase
MAGLDSASAGSSDLRTVHLDGGETVRVLSVPIVLEGEVVGVVQGVRSTREMEGQLEDLRWIIAMGIVLAIVVSAPAGLYLSSRAMQPINTAFDRQRQFVADASHELRTPMTLVRANTEVALLEAPPEARVIEPELRSVLREIDNVDRLISELMLIAQLDSGALRIERERLDLSATVAGAVEDMRPLFDEHGINLRCETNGSLPAMIDAGRIAQVVRILLDNARKHTARGGDVAVDVERNGTAATITVNDTGSGIPPAHLERVFDRFYRADRARSRQTGGAGLGLPIARAITVAHDGQISIESQPGQGTTVLVSLPLAR